MWLIDKLFNRKIEGESSLDPLANKVKVDGDEVTIDGTLNAKKVVEEGDTELIDLSSYVPTDNIKSHTLYAKAYIRHGFLFIVCSGVFVTKEIASALNLGLFNNFLSALPSGIADKLYRSNGTKVSETSAGGAFGSYVAGVVSPRSNGSTQTQNQCILASNEANQLVMSMRGFPALSEDTSVFIDARFVLAL